MIGVDEFGDLPDKAKHHHTWRLQYQNIIINW